ncbi:hypothetical protein, partial [Jeotgalibaca caeni]|uniref:hypothetical protein n=1 Tax=Jeotgalibaca caeni TaxID=3028623 RepID=UPI00237DE899
SEKNFRRKGVYFFFAILCRNVLQNTFVNTFLEFEVVLPFYIPLGLGKTITLGSDEGFYSYRFDEVIVNTSFKYPFEKPAEMLDVQKTKLIMMVAIRLSYKDFLKEAEFYYNYYFDKLIDNLNTIVISYMIATKDDESHYLTKEMLPSHVVVSTTDLNTWESNRGLFLLHENVPYKKGLLTEEEIREIIRMQVVATYELNPFVTGEKYVLFAKRYMKQGFYQEAVLYAQVSVEVFIRQLFKELLIEADNKLDEEVTQILEDTSFMSIIKSKLPHYLGGNWNIKNETTAVGKWYKNTYLLRNRAIHVGKIPDFSESSEALHDAIEFRQFVLERVVANKRKYPTLRNYFI